MSMWTWLMTGDGIRALWSLVLKMRTVRIVLGTMKKKSDYQLLMWNSWRNGASKIKKKKIVKRNTCILIDETQVVFILGRPDSTWRWVLDVSGRIKHRCQRKPFFILAWNQKPTGSCWTLVLVPWKESMQWDEPSLRLTEISEIYDSRRGWWDLLLLANVRLPWKYA